jgi:ubiquinone/menaquinone biosynthesis C-methylase UbiE
LSNLITQQDIKILDICTCTAANAIEVAKHNINAKFVGIDISKEMLHIAKKKISKIRIINIKLCKMDATKTAFKDGSFDVILISLVLHEILDKR